MEIAQNYPWHLRVHFDGNTSQEGQMTLGAVVCAPSGRMLIARTEQAGLGLNTEAELRAAHLAVKLVKGWTRNHGRYPWVLIGDNRGVIKVLNGERDRFQNPDLTLIAHQVRKSLDGHAVEWLPRKQNIRAHRGAVWAEKGEIGTYLVHPGKKTSTLLEWQRFKQLPSTSDSIAIAVKEGRAKDIRAAVEAGKLPIRILMHLEEEIWHVIRDILLRTEDRMALDKHLKQIKEPKREEVKRMAEHYLVLGSKASRAVQLADQELKSL